MGGLLSLLRVRDEERCIEHLAGLSLARRFASVPVWRRTEAGAEGLVARFYECGSATGRHRSPPVQCFQSARTNLAKWLLAAYLWALTSAASRPSFLQRELGWRTAVPIASQAAPGLNEDPALRLRASRGGHTFIAAGAIDKSRTKHANPTRACSVAAVPERCGAEEQEGKHARRQASANGFFAATPGIRRAPAATAPELGLLPQAMSRQSRTVRTTGFAGDPCGRDAPRRAPQTTPVIPRQRRHAGSLPDHPYAFTTVRILACRHSSWCQSARSPSLATCASGPTVQSPTTCPMVWTLSRRRAVRMRHHHLMVSSGPGAHPPAVKPRRRPPRHCATCSSCRDTLWECRATAIRERAAGRASSTPWLLLNALAGHQRPSPNTLGNRLVPNSLIRLHFMTETV